MNYKHLKAMIDWIIHSYACPECNSKVDENSLDIIWAAWNTTNIDIACPNCKKHSIIKTEALSLNLSNKGLSKENIDKLKDKLLKEKWINLKKVDSIKDNEIVELNKNLKKTKLNVADLFGDVK